LVISFAGYGQGVDLKTNDEKAVFFPCSWHMDRVAREISVDTKSSSLSF